MTHTENEDKITIRNAGDLEAGPSKVRLHREWQSKTQCILVANCTWIFVPERMILCIVSTPTDEASKLVVFVGAFTPF